MGRGFKGEYNHTVDAKGRLIVPAKFREALGETFVVTKGLDGCHLCPAVGTDKADYRNRSISVYHDGKTAVTCSEQKIQMKNRETNKV